MSNFIELTNRETGNSISVNLDFVQIFFPDDDGTMLVKYCPDVKAKVLEVLCVRESYEKVRHLIRKSSRSFSCNTEFSEEAKSIICDKLCRYSYKINDQDELDARCENCPLCEL